MLSGWRRSSAAARASAAPAPPGSTAAPLTISRSRWRRAARARCCCAARSPPPRVHRATPISARLGTQPIGDKLSFKEQGREDRSRARGCDGGRWEINAEYPVSFVDRRPLVAHMALRSNRICSALDGILKFEQRVSFARRLMDILSNHRLAVESQRLPL